MALLSMAVWDTDENERSSYTWKTLTNLFETVNWKKHRLIISDNNSCERTKEIYKTILSVFPKDSVKIIYNIENLGTAEAINKAWRLRELGENAIKMDNDVIIHQTGWVEELELAISIDPKLGIVGLKRKDCWENPAHPDPFYKSELKMLSHDTNLPWVVVEKVNHVMGTCQMYSSALLDKIGYLQQPSLYGFDDSWAAIRCKKAGFYSAFIPHINIDHIDTGTTSYQGWKEKHASEQWKQYHEMLAAWEAGKSVYYNPFETDLANSGIIPDSAKLPYIGKTF